MQAVFYQRDFSNKLSLSVNVSVERYSHHMLGGPLKAILIAPAGADRWEFLKLLRCPVEIYGENKAQPLWWGFVNRVTVPQGAQRFGRGLDGMYNSVQVRYATDGITETGTDIVSIAEYGTKELLIRSFDLTGLEAAQLRGTELEDKKNPKTEIEFSSGDDVIEIECAGWYETLKWKHYTNTTEGNISNTTQISTIVSSVGQFLRGTLIIDAAGVVSNQMRDTRDGLSCVNELLQAGTSNYRPLLAHVDRNRNLRVWERTAEPPAGAVDYIMQSDGSLESFAGGARVPDENCVVGKWVQVKDSPLDFAFFIESAEYVVEDRKTTYRPAGAYEPRRLAKYIADVVTGDGPHLWPGLYQEPIEEFAPYWVALGKSGDQITTIRGVAWDSVDNIVYVTGQFTVIGGVVAVNFAKLDMATGQWYALNTTGAPGSTNTGWAVAIAGSKVYFGTQGSGVGCFWEYDTDTDTWTDLSSGTSGPVSAIVVDGTDVYLGGAFLSMPGSADSNYISKWNGSAFSALGTGLTYSGGGSGGCYDMVIGGGGLYAVGLFDNAGGVSVLNIAFWDGANWFAMTGLGTTTNGPISVEIYNGELYADNGNLITGIVLKWDGTNWITVGTTNGVIQGLTVSGDGAYLYTIGNFTVINNVTMGNSAYWDGSAWYAMGEGLSGATVANAEFVMFDSVHPIAVGNFTQAESKPALGIAMYITTLQGLFDFLNNGGSNARPGGPDGAVQYNRSGRFAGEQSFLYDEANDNLILGGYTVPVAGANSWHQINQDVSPGHLIWAFGATVAGFIGGVAAGGTVESPTAITLDRILFVMRGRGQYGTTVSNVSASRAYMQFVADANWSSTDQAARIEGYVTPANSVTPQKMFTWSGRGLDMPELSIDPVAPSTDRWGLYPKSDGWYAIDDLGNVTGPLGTGGSGTTDHNALGNLQGGTTDEYYHVTASQQNLLIGSTDANSLHYHAVTPVFTARQTNTYATTINATSVGVVLCDTEDIDSGNYHSTTDGKFTPLVAGTYCIRVMGALRAVTADKDVWVGVRKNGTTTRWLGLASASTGGDCGASGSIDVFLDGVDDYVQFVMYNGDSSNRQTYDDDGTEVWWQGHRISPIDIAGW